MCCAKSTALCSCIATHGRGMMRQALCGESVGAVGSSGRAAAQSGVP